MKKLKEIKEAITNPPAGRLERIEYQSHFMQILGVMVVCAILIWKGLWYIIFAFIFSIGVSYSQGVGAYRRYRIINQYKEPYNPKLDKSPTRRRDYIIREAFGKYVWILAAITSIVITYLLVPYEKWYMKISFGMIILFNYLIIYFFMFYFIAKPFYNRRIKIKKEVKKNDIKKFIL